MAEPPQLASKLDAQVGMDSKSSATVVAPTEFTVRVTAIVCGLLVDAGSDTVIVAL